MVEAIRIPICSLATDQQGRATKNLKPEQQKTRPPAAQKGNQGETGQKRAQHRPQTVGGINAAQGTFDPCPMPMDQLNSQRYQAAAQKPWGSTPEKKAWSIKRKDRRSLPAAGEGKTARGPKDMPFRTKPEFHQIKPRGDHRLCRAGATNRLPIPIPAQETGQNQRKRINRILQDQSQQSGPYQFVGQCTKARHTGTQGNQPWVGGCGSTNRALLFNKQ